MRSTYPATVHRDLIIELAARHKLAAVYIECYFVAGSDLMSYGLSTSFGKPNGLAVTIRSPFDPRARFVIPRSISPASRTLTAVNSMRNDGQRTGWRLTVRLKR